MGLLKDIAKATLVITGLTIAAPLVLPIIWRNIGDMSGIDGYDDGGDE